MHKYFVPSFGAAATLAIAALSIPALGPTAARVEAAPPSADARAAAARDIDVHLESASGSPMANTDVTVSVIGGSVKGIQRMHPVVETSTDETGRLAIDLPDRARIGKVTQAEIEAKPKDGSVPLIYDFTVTNGSSSADVATIEPGSVIRAMQGVVSPSPATRARMTGPTVSPFQKGLVASSRSEARLGQEKTTYARSQDATRGVASSSRTSCSSGQVSSWFATGKKKYPYVPTKYAKTTSRARFTWVFRRSNETAMEVSMEVGGDSGKGGLTYSQKNKSYTEWTWAAPRRSTRIYKIKWLHLKQQKACKNAVPQSSNWTLIDVYRWAPWEPRIGNVDPKTSDTFTCGKGPEYVDRIAGEVTVSKDSEVNLRGFFSVAGVTLNANQTDGSSQVFNVKNVARKTAKICGYDAAPETAKLVKEMSY